MTTAGASANANPAHHPVTTPHERRAASKTSPAAIAAHDTPNQRYDASPSPKTRPQAHPIQ